MEGREKDAKLIDKGSLSFRILGKGLTVLKVPVPIQKILRLEHGNH